MVPESGFKPPTYALRMVKFNLTINKNNYLYRTLIINKLINDHCPIGSVKSGAVPSDLPDCNENNCINKLNVVLLFRSLSSM